MHKASRFFNELISQVNFVLDYAIKFVGVLGIIYGVVVIWRFFTGDKLMDLSIDSVLLLCGAVVFVAGFIIAVVTAIVKTFRKEAEDVKVAVDSKGQQIAKIDERLKKLEKRVDNMSRKKASHKGNGRL